MRCEECLPLVEEYLDGELDETIANLVVQHVTACERCASEYKKLEREQELYLSYECDAEAAPAFWDNVLAQVAREKSTPSNLYARLRQLFAGAHTNFSAPRFSATLTALIALVAIGITAGVMLYINSHGKLTDTIERISRKESSPATAASPTPNRAG
ncbi:MAG TPA: zf-HC2 domain-containing protein, partial [Pyrinomonadaceae bacterium]|nr:zf-HC2 domain-containing protein [Pyrinomonadaceae bacterium]